MTEKTTLIEQPDRRRDALAAFAGNNPTSLPQANNVGAVEVAARAMAEVKAAIVMAKEFPRDERAALERILTACGRESLAKRAHYEFPRGTETVHGPSIRLAEVIAQYWGNISMGVIELSRSNGQSEAMAYAWDLETNVREERRFTVKHWRDTKRGGYAVKDERDIYEIIANQGARRKRGCILTVIPGDVQELASAECEQTLRVSVKIDEAFIQSLLTKFDEFEVTKEMLERRMKRSLSAITPGAALQFGRIYNSLKDGVSHPGDWFEPADGEQTTKDSGNTAAKTLDDVGKTDRKPRTAKKDSPAKPEKAAQTADAAKPDKPADPSTEGATDKASGAARPKNASAATDWTAFHDGFVAKLDACQTEAAFDDLLDANGKELSGYAKADAAGRAVLSGAISERGAQLRGK